MEAGEFQDQKVHFHFNLILLQRDHTYNVTIYDPQLTRAIWKLKLQVLKVEDFAGVGYSQSFLFQTNDSVVLF